MTEVTQLVGGGAETWTQALLVLEHSWTWS